MRGTGEFIVEQWTSAAGESDELRLVHSVLAGDRPAFDELVQRHAAHVTAAARRFLRDPNDLEDVVQETFLRAYQNMRRFRGESRLRTWLIQIALNVCRDRQRGFWKRRVVLAVDWKGATCPTGESFSDGAVLQQTIEDAVAELPEKLRLPFALHAFVELTGCEIAEILGCTESTVWSRIYTARKKLQVSLAGVLER